MQTRIDGDRGGVQVMTSIEFDVIDGHVELQGPKDVVRHTSALPDVVQVDKYLSRSLTLRYLHTKPLHNPEHFAFTNCIAILRVNVLPT